ncbi:uncharacterized protein LOC119726817 [Patiria miniata]|uniref:Uncharacterized protein n=1 Tax=Patiria miniata TaxID=46514 RepID=A0A913ZTS2_PATMI|nr:uncharacterized protein LOC119726817 [Patiria miniata]
MSGKVYKNLLVFWDLGIFRGEGLLCTLANLSVTYKHVYLHQYRLAFDSLVKMAISSVKVTWTALVAVVLLSSGGLCFPSLQLPSEEPAFATKTPQIDTAKLHLISAWGADILPSHSVRARAPYGNSSFPTRLRRQAASCKLYNREHNRVLALSESVTTLPYGTQDEASRVDVTNVGRLGLVRIRFGAGPYLATNDRGRMNLSDTPSPVFNLQDRTLWCEKTTVSNVESRFSPFIHCSDTDSCDSCDRCLAVTEDTSTSSGYRVGFSSCTRRRTEFLNQCN